LHDRQGPETAGALYSARSTWNDGSEGPNVFLGHRDVQVHWFRLDRDPRALSHAASLKRFEKLADHRRRVGRAVVDLLFTRPEIESLLLFLEADPWLREVQAVRHSLPLCIDEIRNMPDIRLQQADIMAPLVLPTEIGGLGFVNLYRFPGYSLPFRVRGCFDVQLHPLAEDSPIAQAEASLRAKQGAGETVSEGVEKRRIHREKKEAACRP
jgi:hypothetical protein